MIIHGDAHIELKNIKSNSVDLIITDPPYLISKKSNFDSDPDNMKFKAHSIDFGDWDSKELDWNLILSEYYRILKKGGYIIIFYDIWKIKDLRVIADKLKFKQPRIGCWIKNNPVPINTRANYLSNATEYFISFVKGGKCTFNSHYDNGLYNYSICHGNQKTKHPTQKPLELIKNLIEKHSNEGDLIVDSFAGSGTTGEASKLLNRNFILIEKEEEYINIIKKRLNYD